MRPPSGAREHDAAAISAATWLLHVLGAAAPDLVLGEVAAPGVMAPLLGVGGDRVDVAEQAERRAVRLAAKAGDQVRRSGSTPSSSQSKPASPSSAASISCASRSLPGRVGRVEADQPLQQLGAASAHATCARDGRRALHEARLPSRRLRLQAGAAQVPARAPGLPDHDAAGDRHEPHPLAADAEQALVTGLGTDERSRRANRMREPVAQPSYRGAGANAARPMFLASSRSGGSRRSPAARRRRSPTSATRERKGRR